MEAFNGRGSQMECNQMSLALESRAYDKKEGQGGRIGCTLVTGFLGCGKTTLLQHILRSRGSLRVAVLVNEFGEIDIDSLLLDSALMNSSHGLSHGSLAGGCACCSTSGNLKEAVRTAISQDHNFDYIVIETSGLANPFLIAKELEESGIRLDLTVTVVDVETVDTILSIPVAKQQLAMADIVLINKCDLASFGAISDAEDRVEEATGGTKAVRCRFSNVPLELVLNVLVSDESQNLAATAPPETTTAEAGGGFLSHEATTPCFGRKVHVAPTRSDISGKQLSHKKLDAQRGGGSEHGKINELEMQLSRAGHLTNHDGKEGNLVHSVAFCSDDPLSLSAFQDFVTSQASLARGLLRAKGVVWFKESRSTRHFFHFSGTKRSEALYAGPWESQPGIKLVLIGRDKSELDSLKQALDETTSSPGESGSVDGNGEPAHKQAVSEAKDFARLVSKDDRFKLQMSRAADSRGQDLDAECALVMFGLVGSSLRGVHEGDLNASLMQSVNSRGVIFLSSASSLKAGGRLQVAFGAGLSADALWSEVSSAASEVISKAFRDVCPCRCDIDPHMFAHHHGS